MISNPSWSQTPAEGATDAEESAAPAAPENPEQELEALYDKSEVEPAPKDDKLKQGSEKKEIQVQSLSDLAKLSPFSDVAVIQRRFLPKTNRFELSATGFSNLNNPFFNSLGISARLAYYLRERYAIEVLGTAQTTASRQVTDDLEENRRITTDNVVTSRGFYALAFKWNPIYGKMTWLNKTIVPFDINFNIGAGMTITTEGESEPTLHLGTSQVFAWTKSVAFRWDLIWNMFNATVKNDDGSTETMSQNDLFLGFGMSFYFPEATYR